MLKTNEKFDIKFMDASRLSTIGRCETLFMLKCLMGLRMPLQDKPENAPTGIIALDYGTIMHVVLPHMYSGITDKAFEIFDELWKDFGYGEGDPKRNTGLSRSRMIDFIMSHQPERCLYDIERFPFSTPAKLISKNEVPFLIDAGMIYPLAGRIDAVVRWLATDTLWAYDFKHLGIHTLVMTPNGPKEMQHLSSIDKVIGLNGNPIAITGKSAQETREMYKITLSDGSWVEASDEHTWTICYRSSNEETKTKNVTTLDLINQLKKQRTQKRNRSYWLPQQGTTQFRHKSVSFDPYTLGALLGDGSFVGSITLHNTDYSLLDRIKIKYKCTETVDPRSNVTSLRLIGQAPKIRALGLYKKKSKDKFIPESYLYNIESIRLSILQGLMDTDGTVNPSGTPVFTTTSPRLAAGVKLLVQSLGGICSIASHISMIYEKEYGLAFQCTFRLPNNRDAFFLQRKKDKVKNDYNYAFRRNIISVDPLGEKPCQCISVAAQDGLYLVEDFIPTHNTSSEISDRYFDGFWNAPQPITYTIALQQIVGEKIEGLILEVMRISKTNIENQLRPIYVNQVNIDRYLGETKLTCARVAAANESGIWRQNHALCSTYSCFGFPSRPCAYKTICDERNWQDGARFYERTEPFDPLKEK